MDIILYLTELIKTRKTVGVIGLGTLYKKKSPGKYDAAQHAFIPPTYSLAFTSELKEDEELVNYISIQRNISSESASYYISEFADQIQAQLAEQYEAELGSIGKLKFVNDELILVPADEDNFGNDFYGLPILPERAEESQTTANEEQQLATIEEENKLEEENPGQETPIEATYSNIYDEQPVVEEITEVEPVITDQPVVEAEQEVPTTVAEEPVYFEEEPKKRGSLFIKILIVLLVIAAAGAFAYFINPKFFDQYLQQNHEDKPSKNVPIVPNDSLKVKPDTSATDSIRQQTAAKTLVDTVVVDSTKTYYEVIGTSENSRIAADKYIARVAKKGITAKHFKLSKTRYSVSLGTFTNDQQSIKYRDSMRVLLKNPEIYIKIMKPKKHTK